jgi:hypothetical protein
MKQCIDDELNFIMLLESSLSLKSQLLQGFAVTLMKFNPMNLGNNDSYVNEALSILSRFTEAGLHIPSENENELVLQVATSLVKQSLEFWFNNVDNVNCEDIARVLLKLFLEQLNIKSVTIG